MPTLKGGPALRHGLTDNFSLSVFPILIILILFLPAVVPAAPPANPPAPAAGGAPATPEAVAPAPAATGSGSAGDSAASAGPEPMVAVAADTLQPS